MASDPHAPKHPQMRSILKDQALSKTSRLCAVELYYHTDWKSGRLICGAEPAAHLRRHLDISESAARRSVRQLKEQGYIKGCFFNPTPVTTDTLPKVTPPPVITDTQYSSSSLRTLSSSKSSRPDTRASAEKSHEVKEEDYLVRFKNFLNNY